MKDILEKLAYNTILSRTETASLMQTMATGNANDNDIKALLEAYNKRMITPEEMQGFMDVLLGLCINISIEKPTIDVCGTGGDGKNTFNISTISSIVLSAMGYAVTKHGNHGVSSVSGSSTVLELLGYTFTNNVEKLQKQLEATNYMYLHAPLFHSSLKHVAPVRKAMGVKTFFNMLGPLVNPVQTAYQCSGVYNNEVLTLYKSVLSATAKNFYVYHSSTGYDEITLTDDVVLHTKTAATLTINNNYFKVPILMPNDLFGGDTKEEAATQFTQIIMGKGSPAQNHVIAANVSVAASLFTDAGYSMHDVFNKAVHMLTQGEVATHFQKIIDYAKQ
jgi:anthranilate phosphoribosyltransferase